ncbi:Fe-S cluster assembly sulfur transfer protein SufU [Sinimarinibacterium flocculans]|uniref:Nitrogen fixation NifU-like protein n=1 Tax=Sinimarinibacterium flocculans TaxID=985250 RepID=A0A318E5E3_9GAMM|nr:SUF system NifU family Fe-S cluster assembly protein [Sinimarinibacterium flocculans]PXV65713.1 nitrogen fixation NifU-like protein [Sinimarinibacterium flocculans]
MSAQPFLRPAPAADPRHAALLEHARHPRNRRDLDAATHHGSGSNALCGDSVSVSLVVDGDVLREIAFKERSCNVCKASASMMTELVHGRPLAEVRALCADFRRWVAEGDAAWTPPDALAPLALLRERSARHRCLTLAWEALADALG